MQNRIPNLFFKLTLIILVLILMTACTPSDYEQIKQTNQDLSEQNQALLEEIEQNKKVISDYEGKVKNLETEIDQIKNGPSRLLAETKQAYEESKWSVAIEKANELIEKHPTSAETTEAKQVIAQANESMEAERKQKELEAQKKAEEDKKRVAAALKSMSKEYDEFNDVTWITDKSSPYYADNNAFYLYFMISDEKATNLRMKVRYSGDDWYFVNYFQVKIIDTNDQYRINADSGIIRDNEGGDVWEYLDNTVTAENIKMINKIITSEKTMIRAVGSDYDYDRTITSTEKKALQNVLDAYVELGGQLPK